MITKSAAINKDFRITVELTGNSIFLRENKNVEREHIVHQNQTAQSIEFCRGNHFI